MTCKAVCLVTSVQQDSVNDGKFYIDFMYTGLEPSNRVNQTFKSIGNVDPTITAATLESAIKQTVKDELTNNNGYSFGLFDTVRLIGALL